MTVNILVQAISCTYLNEWNMIETICLGTKPVKVSGNSSAQFTVVNMSYPDITTIRTG